MQYICEPSVMIHNFKTLYWKAQKFISTSASLAAMIFFV
jgi:hypothetical protein